VTARFVVDLASESSTLRHVWEHTVGSCHAPLGLRADWQSQLHQAHEDLGFRHVRFHGLLSDDVGTLVCQEEELIHSFHNIDVVYDSLLDMGVRPFVELSFMPTALASGDRTVFSYKANVTPPRDLMEWQALVRRLAEHWLDRYGKPEVSRWSFEVWNEPNLKDFWTGTRHDYFDLYRVTARTLKEAEPDLRVGGPATAKNAWIPEFLEFCASEDVPVDFVTTHHYPTDAFDDPEVDTEAQLSKAKRSILRDQALRARREAGEKELYYTEWNSSSNSRDPLHDQPYAAAFVAKTALEAAGIVDGYSFWTFSDIFEETYFPSLPFHGGFGLLTIHGVPKPTYRAFELLHELGEECYAVSGDHPTVDAWAVRRGGDVMILLTNHALPRHPIERELVEIEIRGGQVPRGADLRRIDEDHANAVATWRAMGAPEYPSRRQVEEIVEASRFRVESLDVDRTDERAVLTVTLPPHAVASIVVRELCA
jgi:xylan 1,4-beta-xylosidase